MVERWRSPDLPALLQWWEITLVAANKSPTTITSNVRGVTLNLRWCEESGHQVEITRARVQRYGAELSAAGKEANPIRLRQAALRQITRWFVDENAACPHPGVQGPASP